MRENIKSYILLTTFLFSIFIFCSCSKDDENYSEKIVGLWIQEKVTEDEQEIDLSDAEKNLSLLFERNGVYRTYAKDAVTPKEHFGTWIVTDENWLNITADTWHLVKNPMSIEIKNPSDLAKRWTTNHIHIRMTILSITGDQLQLRIKTYVGERKYSALFVEHERPDVTEATIEELTNEYKTLKTYIFTFKKQQ